LGWSASPKDLQTCVFLWFWQSQNPGKTLSCVKLFEFYTTCVSQVKHRSANARKSFLLFLRFAVPSVCVNTNTGCLKLFEFLSNQATTWQVQSTKCFRSETQVCKVFRPCRQGGLPEDLHFFEMLGTARSKDLSADAETCVCVNTNTWGRAAPSANAPWYCKV
jgi:hypothetical protein